MRRLFAIAAVLLSGCGVDTSPLGAAARQVTLTNLVEVVRETVVTNTVTLTNVVVVRKVEPRELSLRKTAPYSVVGKSLSAGQLRKLAAAAGARVIECESASVALVEASDKAVGNLRAGKVLSVHPLAADDKIAADAGGNVRIIPMSAIDVAAIANAIRSCGGEIFQVIASGSPAIRAKVSFAAMKKLAGRGDVRRIERDGK